MDAKAKKPQKMNKIACILVRDIRRIDLIKIEKINQFSNFVHDIFGIPTLNRISTLFLNHEYDVVTLKRRIIPLPKKSILPCRSKRDL